MWTAKHFPDIKEDGLEADVVEAPGGEDDDGEVVFATFSGTQVYQVLLKVEAVLIRNLKTKYQTNPQKYKIKSSTSNSNPMPPASTFTASSGT